MKIDDTLIEAKWYINSEDGYWYLLNIYTGDILAKADKNGNLLFPFEIK